MTAPISEADLHAFADGRLAPERTTQIEGWLAAHPEHRDDVDAWRAQSAGLHRAFDGVLDEPVPARLLPAANASSWPRLRALAAAVGWLALGGSVGFLVRGAGDPSVPGVAINSLPQRAAVAHAVYSPEVRHPVEVGADQEAHLVAWLSKRLGGELKPPRLDDAGYRLVGGRLLPGDTKGVAQFMYEDERRQRLTLYVQPDAGQAAEAGFRYARENGVDVFYWVDGRFGYALSGTTGRDDMLRLSTLAYRALTR